MNQAETRNAESSRRRAAWAPGNPDTSPGLQTPPPGHGSSPRSVAPWRGPGAARAPLAAWLLGALLLMTGCDRDRAAAVKAPSTLPDFDPAPAPWPVSAKARGLWRDGLAADHKGDQASARALLTEAISLDRSLTGPRVDLARLYVRLGMAEVAAELLSALQGRGAGCGECAEALMLARDDPGLAQVWETAPGRALAPQVPAQPLPFARWATALGKALAAGAVDEIPRFVHPQEPFLLVRTCPECTNPQRRKPDERELQGAPVAAKLAERFAIRGDPAAVPLRIGGEPTCSGRCCDFAVAPSVTVGEAALRRLCFRPLRMDRGAVTRIEVVYGQSLVDRQRAQARDRASGPGREPSTPAPLPPGSR